MSKYKVIRNPDTTKSGASYWVVCIAIGEDHREAWEAGAMPSVNAYCEKHGLGFATIIDYLDHCEDPKHPAWQKLLVGSCVLDCIDDDAAGIMVLDTDIVVNYHMAPNVFNKWDDSKIGLVSKRFGMPYEYFDAAKRVCFLRNSYVDADYPLDSIFLFTLEQAYEYEGLPVQPDEACSGMFVFNPSLHSDLFEHAYQECKPLGETLALEQTHFNYYVQSRGLAQFLDYRFQTQWVLEMACRYPFLYMPRFAADEAVVSECVGASLASCYMLHFSGRWNESKMLTLASRYLNEGFGDKLGELNDYLLRDVTGVARGLLAPK